MRYDYMRKVFIVTMVFTAWLWSSAASASEPFSTFRTRGMVSAGTEVVGTASSHERFATLTNIPIERISHRAMETVQGKVTGGGFIVLLGPDGLLGSTPGPNAIVVLGPDGLVCINAGCTFSFGTDNIGPPGPDSLVLLNGESLLGPFKQPGGVVLFGPNGLLGTRTPRGTAVVLGPAGILGPQTGPGGIVLFGNNGLLGGAQQPEFVALFGPQALLPGLSLGGL